MNPETKHRIELALGALAFVSILAVIWTFCLARWNYIWLAHDDAMMMVPAIRIEEGKLMFAGPFTAYPGLTYYVQWAIMRVFGEGPYAQHIYSALQSTVLAGVLFVLLRKILAPAILYILLFVVYYQNHIIGPPPNPGYSFQIFALFSVLLIRRFTLSGSNFYLLAAACAAAVSFHFKQYGVFLPLIFLLYSSFQFFLKPGRRPLWESAVVFLLNLIPWLAFTYVYVWKSVVGNREDPSLWNYDYSNIILLVLPWLLAILALPFLKKEPAAADTPESPEGLSPFWRLIQTNFIFGGVFLLAVAGIFVALFGASDRLLEVLKFIFIDGPKEVNGLQQFIGFGPGYWEAGVFYWVVILLPLSLVFVKNKYAHFALALFIGLVFIWGVFRALNNSGSITPHVIMVVCAVLGFRLERNNPAALLLVCLTPLLAIHVPYPHYNYMLAIIYVLGYFALADGKEPLVRLPLVTNVVLLSLALVFSYQYTKFHAYILREMPEYRVGDYVIKGELAALPSLIEQARGDEPGCERLCYYFRYLDRKGK